MSKRSDKCIQESKNKLNFNPHKVSKAKFINNLENKKYMKNIIHDIERIAKLEAKKNEIRIYDLSVTLPPPLYKRVSKILQLLPIEEDNFEDDNEKDIKLEYENYYSKPEEFNESTCSIIEAAEVKYNDFEIQIDAKVMRKTKSKPRKSWLSEYICKKRNDRILWNSKLYPLETKIEEKQLNEQAEILMNSASERFTEWINNITKNTVTNLSKDYLMSLFKVNSGASILGTIQIDPKIMGAVPGKVAATWGMPENAIEIQLDKRIKEIMRNVPKEVRKVAFGATLPYHMRPWIPTDAYNLIKPDFPDELLSCKLLFEGITHLKAIREFISYCKNNVSVQRPQYLVDVGCFKTTNIRASDENDIPLYELLNCRY